MPDESDIKRSIVKIIREEGGYARRIEDKFLVGMPDLVLIPKHGLVYFAEVKIIRGKAEIECRFGATPRQMEELKRLYGVSEHVVPLLIAYGPVTRRLYACLPSQEAYARDALAYTDVPWYISGLLTRYHENRSLLNADTERTG